MLLWGEESIPMETTEIYAAADPEEMPSYTGEPYTVVNDNIPEFAEEDFKKESFEIYSELDELGRCGAAYANIGPDLMPQKERGKIGQVRPSGWQTVKYDCVDGKYLYNLSLIHILPPGIFFPPLIFYTTVSFPIIQ